MVDLISSNAWGVYIVEEENGQIAANTPGGIDLDNLVEGDTYIYFDQVLTFDQKYMSQREGDDFLGWKTMQTSSSGTVSGNVGGGYRHFITFMAKVTEALGEKMGTLFVKHVASGDGDKYLVHQRATTTFEQFSNTSGTLKNYCEIIIRGFELKETDQKGKDNKIVIITLEECHNRN